MEFKVGNTYVVVSNKCDYHTSRDRIFHEFPIGEIVELIQLEKDGDHLYRSKSKDQYLLNHHVTPYTEPTEQSDNRTDAPLTDTFTLRLYDHRHNISYQCSLCYGTYTSFTTPLHAVDIHESSYSNDICHKCYTTLERHFKSGE